MRKYTRRELMVRGTGLGMAAVGVMLSIPALGFLLSPLFTQRRTLWVTVGPIDDVPIGVPTPLFALMPTEEGWPVPPVERVVYVVRKHDGSTDAFSNICTHMQCDVHWDATLQQFLCPCHGGLYDINGLNVGGPPPQPLPQWVNRVVYDPNTRQHILEVQNKLGESI